MQPGAGESLLGKIVKASWKDAWYDHPQTKPSDWSDECAIVTYGRCVRDEDELISIAGEEVGDGEYRAVTHIPRLLIVPPIEVLNA
jgi:hypothetical protein